MGGSQKGLSFRDLLCGLAVLTKGELEEKIKCMFLYMCYIFLYCLIRYKMFLISTKCGY